MIMSRPKFWNKVDIKEGDDCWLWTATTNGIYGVFWDHPNGRNEGAHRMSWILTNGPITEGLSVLHRCDTPLCVNPRHLFLGTTKDNSVDMMNKGRASNAVGEDTSNPKLTNEDVMEIKTLLTKGMVQWEIAKRFNVSQTTICFISQGKLWGHIT